VKGVEKLKTAQPYMLTGVVLLISIPAFLATTKRNPQWKNDFTLFTTDADVHPNSALCNGNAGSQYMNYALWFLGRDTIIQKDTMINNQKKIVFDTIHKFGRDTVKVHYYARIANKFLLRATKTHKKYVNGFLNLGLTYYYQEQYGLAAEAWGHAYQHFSTNATLLQYQQMLVDQADVRAAKKDFRGAAQFMGYAAMAVPGDQKAWSDYGGASFMVKDFSSAVQAFNQAMYVIEQKIPPQQRAGNTANVTDLQNQERQLQAGYRASLHNEKCLKAWVKDSTNADSTIVLANAYMGTPDFFPESKRLLNKALVLRPNDKRALFLLDSLSGLEEKQKKLQAPPIK
ncbi:MAG TPA: hypothetical protein VFJ43_07595, partial [Bacteroidia bacterium]|nr:hypothetical protein [Bacteroidia bacterium]